MSSIDKYKKLVAAPIGAILARLSKLSKADNLSTVPLVALYCANGAVLVGQVIDFDDNKERGSHSVLFKMDKAFEVVFLNLGAIEGVSIYAADAWIDHLDFTDY